MKSNSDGASYFILLTRNAGDHIKVGEMDQACYIYGLE